MSAVAGRMKVMRERRRARSLREIRLNVPGARSQLVRTRIAAQIKALDAATEEDAMRWTESVSTFDNDETQ